jgi:hypothetical protein
MSLDNAKRPRPEGDSRSDVCKLIHDARSLVDNTLETLRESFVTLDVCAKSKEAFQTSAARVTDDNEKDAYERMIQESEMALETRTYIIDELVKVLGIFEHTVGAPVGERVLIEEPPKEHEKGASDYTKLYRIRKFMMTNVAETSSMSGSLTIGRETLRLAPFEIQSAYRMFVQPEYLLGHHGVRGDKIARHLIIKNAEYVDRVEELAEEAPISSLRALLLDNILPHPDERILLTDAEYVQQSVGTTVDVKKVCASLLTYKNSFDSASKHSEYVQCRTKNVNDALEILAKGSTLSKHPCVKYRHMVTSSVYHIDISDLEGDPELLFDVIRSCRSFGKENMVTRVPRFPGRGTYLCLNFEYHRDLNFDQAATVKLFQKHVSAVYWTILNYCCVSAGMRAAVENALSTNVLDASNDILYRNYLPCGLEYGVQNITNAVVMHLYTSYQGQLTVMPLPPSPPPLIPEFPTCPLPEALKTLKARSAKEKDIAPTPGVRRFTSEMWFNCVNFFEKSTDEVLKERITRALPEYLPKDEFSYDQISDDDGLRLYNICFPPQMEHDSDDDWDLEDE